MASGRRHQDRRRHRVAQQRDPGVDIRDVVEDAGPQPHFRQAVMFSTALISSSAPVAQNANEAEGIFARA